LLIENSKNRLDLEKAELEFFNAFPENFSMMEAFFGSKANPNEFHPFYNSDKNLLIQKFDQLGTISDSMYFEKLIKISLEGNWHDDHLGFNFGLTK